MRLIYLSLLISFSVSYANNDTLAPLQHQVVKLDSIIFEKKTTNKLFDKKNFIKLSFPLLSQPAIAMQYERNVYKKLTVGASVNYTSRQEFFILKTIANQKISNEFAKSQLSNIKTTIFSITPEIKIYFGKDVYKGFYLAPFVRFSNYNVEFPLQFIEDTFEKHYQKVTFSGKFNTVTLGISIGSQWNIYKNLYVDWLIVGPHIGKSNERLILESNLSSLQQRGIKKSLDIIKTSIDKTNSIPDIKFDYEVDENGGVIKIKNPWAGVRLQLGIGYRF
jgi:hypothetical protein